MNPILLQITMFNRISILFRKELLLEFKQPFSVAGLLLYLAGVLLTVYAGLITVDPQIWITLYWIIVLFIGINAAARSFMQEPAGRWFYYYQLSHPGEFLTSKFLYNIVLLLLLNTICWVLYAMVLGDPIRQHLWFVIAIFFGSVSIALLLTLMSAVASKAGQNATMMSILSLPVLIPLMLVLVNMSMAALQPKAMIFPWKEVMMLTGLDLIVVLLGYILFPYLWKD